MLDRSAQNLAANRQPRKPLMRIAVTGATGFIGRYIVAHLAEQGHAVSAWRRPSSDCSGITVNVDWITGELGEPEAAEQLCAGCDAVVHGALYRPGGGFIGGEGDVREFARFNILGTLELIEAARAAGVRRFVFISTCAVHDKILSDRPLDEAHPLWAKSHYGAHKAALEEFVHSYGLGRGYEICSLRPTGVYGVAHPPQQSKWFELVQAVVRGDNVTCHRGGKEVHAADVARAVGVLLTAPAAAITGEAFNCYDRYVSEYEVAQLAKQMANSKSAIAGEAKQPQHQIETAKLRALGMTFGGEALLQETIQALVESVDS
jgi:nucleoside-diphosphate-sugar epimerase